jgi:DNA primase catalytic subunit
MTHWKDNETRCRASSNSGKRCKVRVPAGDYLCEHHAMDLAHFVKNPSYVAGLMKTRYPKRHHPACDRKGQNDCNCHTYSNGALAVKGLKESIQKSMQLSPLYRRKRKLEHRLKVKKIRAYYNSITEAELWLPVDAGFRQFRFFLWDDKQERIVVRVIKDNFRHKRTLLKWLRKLAPLHVYYTTSAWLNPQGIGPDPKGKHGDRKMRKRGWKLTQYHDTMLYQGLYFDVDYDNADYDEGLVMLLKLKKVIESEAYPETLAKTTRWNSLGFLRDERTGSVGLRAYHEGLRGETQMVFSGGKGFHLFQQEWSSNDMHNNWSTATHYKQMSADDRQDWNRGCKQTIVNVLRHMDSELLLDWEVTVDPRRIIRLPGTVHGKTLRLCKIVTMDDFDVDFEGNWRYNADDPIG